MGDELIFPTHWRPEVEHCLQEKCLSSSARSDMVRTLVNLLFTKSSKPSRDQCEKLARRIILKYPFAKDDLGNGYVSRFNYNGFVGVKSATGPLGKGGSL